ncbi:MAG: hypothetical protein Q8Q24_02035 [bacterium]|nr:hypothetical protein [bacterium]
MVLKKLKIQIEELKITKRDKQHFLELLSKATGEMIKGVVINHFWIKIDFIKKLIEIIKNR